MDWGGMHLTAVALAKQGHHVRWATEESAFSHLQRLGIEGLPLPTTGWLWPPPPMPAGLSPQERARERERRAVAVWLDPSRVLPAVEALVQVIRMEHPDMLVSEPFVAAAGFAAELTHIPLVVVGWPATEMPKRVPPRQAEAAHLARDWFREMKTSLGVQGTYWASGPLPWLHSPHAHVTYFTREWYGPWKVKIPPTWFVGGYPVPPEAPSPPWLNALPSQRPLVLVTLGSAFVQDLPFFQMAADAVLRAGGFPILITGNQALSERLHRDYGARARVEPWVSFGHVFPRLALVIHHGGVGTTHAAIVHALPQFIVPHAADQFYQAARVQRMGVGVAMRAHEVTPTHMRAWVQDLLTDVHWREQAQALAEEMAALGGVDRAAAILAALAAGQDPGTANGPAGRKISTSL